MLVLTCRYQRARARVLRHKSVHPARHRPKSITPATQGSPEELTTLPSPRQPQTHRWRRPAYQEALHQVNSMLQGFDDLDAPSRRLDVLRTPGPADAFPAAALDSPPRPPPSAVAAAQAPATEDTIRRKKPPSPPLYAWESRTAPGAPASRA